MQLPLVALDTEPFVGPGLLPVDGWPIVCYSKGSVGTCSTGTGSVGTCSTGKVVRGKFFVANFL